MVNLSDVCADNLVAYHIFQFSASVGLKLLRAKVISDSFTPQKICSLVALSAKAQIKAADLESIRKWLYTVPNDCADELLASGLLHTNDPTSLLFITAARNFPVASALLLEHGADLNHKEERRSRQRGLVDIAANAASLDDDWKLVLFLLGQGASPVSPVGVLFTPLRQGNTALARRLLDAHVTCEADCFTSLLCDMCSHGQLPSVTLLIDEVGVPVNALNPRDGLTSTDRALAWHRWDTAEWLISKQNGMPTLKDVALGNLMDASNDPCAMRVLDLLLQRKLLDTHDVLTAAVHRGDFALCQYLLAKTKLQEDTSLTSHPVQLVDQALCHGHLRIAHALLSHGFKPRYPIRCREDATLHGGSCHRIATQILQLLPAAPGEQNPLLSNGILRNCAAEHLSLARPIRCT
jgi:hypothetical protein